MQLIAGGIIALAPCFKLLCGCDAADAARGAGVAIEVRARCIFKNGRACKQSACYSSASVDDAKICS